MINTLKNLQDYLETLCVNNVRVAHAPNNRAFARLNTDDEVELIRIKGGKNIVVVASVNAQRVGDDEENKVRRGVSIMFASRCSAKEQRGVAVTKAMDTAESVLISFLNRMQQDEDLQCFLEIDLEKASWEEIEGPWLDDYYGYMLYLPYNGILPAYDENDWIN